MDALCEGALVCAKKGSGKPKRDFGCKYYCCSEADDEPAGGDEEADDKSDGKAAEGDENADDNSGGNADETPADSDKKGNGKKVKEDDQKAQGGAEGGATTN